MIAYRNIRWLRVPVLVAVAVAGCATYGDWAGRMERAIVDGDPSTALEVLERHEAGRDRDAVLYLLNRAMLLRMGGELDESNAAFARAKRLIEQLTAVSVSEQAGALTVNDTMRSYTGAPYERALIHVYSALNYLELGRPQGARVEALQLDALAARLRGDDMPVPAFARYMSGMVFESLDERDDAMIDYRKAYQTYRRYPPVYGIGVPESLERDLVRLADRQGYDEELARYRDEFDVARAEARGPRPGQGEAIVLVHSGLAPVKRDAGVAAATEDGQLVTVSMPYYARRTPYIVGGRVVADETEARLEPVEDIQALAIETLEKQRPVILARAIARAVVKKKASDSARKKDETLGFMVNVAGVLSERADTRSWSTLPNRIYMARLPLSPGEHALRVEPRDRYGRTAGVREVKVSIETGARRFVSLHWVVPEDLVVRSPGELRRQGH